MSGLQSQPLNQVEARLTFHGGQQALLFIPDKITQQAMLMLLFRVQKSLKEVLL